MAEEGNDGREATMAEASWATTRLDIAALVLVVFAIIMSRTSSRAAIKDERSDVPVL